MNGLLVFIDMMQFIFIEEQQKTFLSRPFWNSKWQTQKKLIFQLCQFSIFFMKISWIGPWISRIDWCKGHWCGSTYIQLMWSWGCSTWAQKQAKNAFFVFLGCFWAYVGQPHDHIGWATPMPFASSNSTHPRTNPWNFHEKILRIGGALKMTFCFVFCFLVIGLSKICFVFSQWKHQRLSSYEVAFISALWIVSSES